MAVSAPVRAAGNPENPCDRRSGGEQALGERAEAGSPASNSVKARKCAMVLPTSVAGRVAAALLQAGR